MHKVIAGGGGLAAPPTPGDRARGPKGPPGPGPRPPTSASYHFGGGVTSVQWTWDPAEGGWVRTQNGSIHLDTGNWPITVDNLVI